MPDFAMEQTNAIVGGLVTNLPSNTISRSIDVLHVNMFIYTVVS